MKNDDIHSLLEFSHLLGSILEITLTSCQGYPGNKGKLQKELTPKDCIEAIRWRISEDNKLINELYDELER